jgi:hypothetical protein
VGGRKIKETDEREGGKGPMENFLVVPTQGKSHLRKKTRLRVQSLNYAYYELVTPEKGRDSWANDFLPSIDRSIRQFYPLVESTFS